MSVNTTDQCKESHLQQAEDRIGTLDVIGVRSVPKIAGRPHLVTHDSRTRHSGRIAPREEMANIDRGSLQRILQAERVDDEHGVVEIEPRDEYPVARDMFRLICIQASSRNSLGKDQPNGLTGSVCAIYPFVLPRQYLRLHCRDYEKVIRV